MYVSETYASQPNELANLAPLLLEAQVLGPRNRARVVLCERAGPPLVVERGELVELRVGEQPEVEEGRGEGRVCLAGRQLDERRERQGHLLDLLLQLLVAPRSSCAEA